LRRCPVSLEASLAELVQLCSKYGWLLMACKVCSLLTSRSLDNDIIILRGGESEASGQKLKGVVVLCLPAALKVEDVHLRMTGQMKLAYVSPLPHFTV
jgi:hypothetical protein